MSLELGDRTNQHCRWLFARWREFEFEENIFSLEELVIGLLKGKESANEENKQFDPGEKGGEPPL